MSRRDYIELGPTPIEEDCVQMGIGTSKAMRDECERFKQQLEREIPIPEGVDAEYAVKRFPYEYDAYYEVVLYYDPDSLTSCEFAGMVEANLPLNWS